MFDYVKYGPYVSIGVVLLILFVLWAFWGGKKYEFIGLAPLDPNTCAGYTGSVFGWGNTSDGIEEDTPAEICPRVTTDDPQITIDNTPIIPEEYLAPPNVCLNKDDSFVTGVAPKRIPGQRNNAFVSRGERKCKQTLERIYGVPFVTVRPDWLKNVTGHNLELDCYNDDLKIATEYNGIQHYVWPNFTGCSFQEFLDLRERDARKVEICNRDGVYLIVVPYNVAHDKIPSFIVSRLPETIKKRLDDEAAARHNNHINV